MRSRRSFTTALALTLTLSAPVAFAGTDANEREQSSRRAGSTIVRVNEDGGFDWADAGVGAAGGVALSMLGFGLVLLVSEHRAQRSSSAVPRSRSHPST